MKPTEIDYDKTYIGKDGSKRYVDDVTPGLRPANEEVEYYILTPGDGPAPAGSCSLKRFAAWAVSEVPTDVTIETLIKKLYPVS